SARLEAQLAALPGVVRAGVELRRPIRDPLAPAVSAPAAPAASVVVIVDDRADRAAIAAAARTLVQPFAPAAPPAIVVEVGAIRPELARVGPFTVERGSKAALQATLAIALAAIAALAGWLAWLHRGAARGQRRGNSAQ
ncbi:MAG: hypothetical protein ACTHU0_29455, partial [Kofleriaceae bacterium]